MIGSILAPIGLFWFAWTARSSIHWICPLIVGFLVAAGNVSISIGAIVYMIDSYESTLSASALAANGILRYVVGACLPLSTLQMYNSLYVDWATSLLGFVALAMLPIPSVLYKWGHQLRLRSRYQTNKV
jgi:sugar phosphate permease